MVDRMTVYDDAGTPFEVIPSVARDLIVDKGWTTSPEKNKPVFTAVEAVTDVEDIAPEAEEPLVQVKPRKR